MQLITRTSNNIFNKLQSILKPVIKLASIILCGFSAFFARAAELDTEVSGDAGAGAGVGTGINVDSLLQVLIALILVICIIFILSILAKKFNILPGTSSGLIKIIAGIPLSGKDRLLLIQVGDEQILVSASPGSINKIHELSSLVEPEAVSSTQDPKAGSFSKLLNSVISRPRT